MRLGLTLISTLPTLAYPQVAPGPDTVSVQTGSISLHGLLWRPPGPGPFPAVLFNHGSYPPTDTIAASEPTTLATVFLRHGYEVLFLFRPGVGLSRGQGPGEGELMDQSRTQGGTVRRNEVQLRLLQTASLDQARAGLAFLRARPEVDQHRLVIVGHSFGGALSLLLAAQDSTIGAVVVFGAAAASWPISPLLRQRLLSAVGRVTAPVLFLHTVNDYSTAPGKALAAEMDRLHKPHQLRIYPAVGRTRRDGHNFLFHVPDMWEGDVMAFLRLHASP